MVAIKIALAVPAVLVVVQTALSFVRSRAWWVRIFDFPRAQIALLNGVLLALFGVSNLGFEESRPWEWILFALLAAAVAVQVSQMLPYTRVWRVQVPAADQEHPGRDRLRIVVSNVCLKNRDTALWLRTVRAEKPDVIVAVEVDEWWCRELRPLEASHPHRVLHPQGNSYGMAVFSRFPLHDTEVKQLVESDVPSVFTSIQLPSGRRVRCVALHPRPPRPDIRQDSDLRDAELVRAGELIRRCELPVIVAGDMNDVAWSHTTHLFQRVAGLLDPRIGRGLYSTFHADHRFLRWPLDHVFHSRHFELIALRRLPHVGSDHFPMLVELALLDQPNRDVPLETMDADDLEQAEDAIESAEEHRANESAAERQARKEADR